MFLYRGVGNLGVVDNRGVKNYFRSFERALSIIARIVSID